jgi:hypothetical protein
LGAACKGKKKEKISNMHNFGGQKSSKRENYIEVRLQETELWISGLCPSSGILNNRKHILTETGSVSFLRWGGGRHPLYWVPYKELT